MMHSKLVFFALSIVAVAFIYFQLHSVKTKFYRENRHVLALLKDLEIKMNIANKHLEQRVLDKSIDTQDERLEMSEQILKHRVAAVVEESLFLKIKRLQANPITKSKTTPPPEHDLETLARVKEFVYNYDMLSDIPKEVRRWYTYISSEVYSLNTLDQNDQRLINYIRRQLLIPPAPENSSLTNPDIPDSTKDSPLDSILKIFNNQKNGIFLEYTASNGEFPSQTLVLERDFEWNGAFIEENPKRFQKMLNSYKKSWLVPTCLSLGNLPQLVYFAANKTGLWKTDEDTEMTEQKSTAKHMLIHCMPLTAIILALDITNIDFFNLDARGEEFEILSSINFEQINIKVVLVDISHSDKSANIFEKFLAKFGYRIFPTDAEWATEKLIFIKASSGL